jgi:hypothetical protein
MDEIGNRMTCTTPHVGRILFCYQPAPVQHYSCTGPEFLCVIKAPLPALVCVSAPLIPPCSSAPWVVHLHEGYRFVDSLFRAAHTPAWQVGQHFEKRKK